MNKFQQEAALRALPTDEDREEFKRLLRESARYYAQAKSFAALAREMAEKCVGPDLDSRIIQAVADGATSKNAIVAAVKGARATVLRRIQHLIEQGAVSLPGNKT